MLTINQVILVCRIQELDNEKNKQNSMLKEKDGDVTILKTQIQSLVCTKFYLVDLQDATPLNLFAYLLTKEPNINKPFGFFWATLPLFIFY
jgi:hypothetical protein